MPCLKNKSETKTMVVLMTWNAKANYWNNIQCGSETL